MTECPYCGEDIEAAIDDAWSGDYWTYLDDFECPKCRTSMEIEVEMEPIFNTKKKKGNSEPPLLDEIAIDQCGRDLAGEVTR